MATIENDIPAAPPLPRGEANGRSRTLDAAPKAAASDGQEAALRDLQLALIKEIDASITKLERERPGENTREHLEVLRSLLKAQVTTYLEHFARRATLFSHTSIMYAGEVGSAGVISTTLRGLLEGGTLTGGQGAKLAQMLGDRRTLIVTGDRATGKSTLLNSLFDLISVDERMVAVERRSDLPALKERSFCVRLSVAGDTDITALFAKARHMNPNRLVTGELHAPEIREFFGFLADDPRCGGLATLRAETVEDAIANVVAALGDDNDEAYGIVARVAPVFVHMRTDEKGRPRLAAIWSVDGFDGAELEVAEVQSGAPAASELAAET